MENWRELVNDPKEIKLFEALENPKYLWRTMAALQRASGMSDAEIRRAFKKYRSLIRESSSESGEPIWALQERYWKRPGISQIMDFISRTSTSS